MFTEKIVASGMNYIAGSIGPCPLVTLFGCTRIYSPKFINSPGPERLRGRHVITKKAATSFIAAVNLIARLSLSPPLVRLYRTPNKISTVN